MKEKKKPKFSTNSHSMKRWTIFTLVALIIFVAISGIVFATPNADTMWDEIRKLIHEWVPRLGGVVMFVGGIMFGLGWKNDDAEGKSRGIMTMTSGAIVTALGLLTTSFF